jgi:hypothetical protein
LILESSKTESRHAERDIREKRKMGGDSFIKNCLRNSFMLFNEMRIIKAYYGFEFISKEETVRIR